MSVNTSDEYLDELLQAIEPIIKLNKPEPEPEPEPEPTVIEEVIEDAMPVEFFMGAEETTSAEAMPAVEAELVEMVEPELAAIEEAEPMPIEEVESGMDLSEFFAVDEIPSDVEPDMGQPASYEDDNSAAIGDLLASLAAEDDDMSMEEAAEEVDIESMLDAVGSEPQNVTEPVSYNQDVKDLLKQFSEDEDLSDIQDMLDKNDNGEALDNSLLDLPDVEVFQLDEEEEEDEEEQSGTEKSLFSKLKKSIKGLFKRKKEKQDIIEEVIEDTEQIEVKGQESSSEFVELNEMSLLDALTGGEGDVEELELDEDMSDIEMLLSGGAFQGSDFVDGERNQVEYLDEPKADATPKKKAGKDKKADKEKKESIFTKILNLLTEEIEDSPKKSVPEADATGITNENLDILENLSKEDKKKAKQDKKKAKKNGKNASKKGDGEEADEKGAKGKKNKKEKKPKKKKEKKEKTDKLIVVSKPEKKLPKRRVLSTYALCFSILAAVLILQNVVMKSDSIKEARYAFDTADYATCFANLSSIEERNEEEEALYQKSLIILSVQRKLDSYENFMLMNRKVEALNSLLEGIVVYREQEANAVEWGVQSQFVAVYQSIMDRLQEFGLSDADVEEILGYESKVTYTKRLDSIVNGTPFHEEEMMENFEIAEPQPFEDVLPGEEDFLPEDTIMVTSASDVSENSEDIPEEGYVEQHGQTVVVGSNPVDIFDGSPDDFGGQNVGNGGTDVSVEVDGGNVVIGDM